MRRAARRAFKIVRPALPRSGAAGKVSACRKQAGRSAGPEAGRGVPTPPSLPLDSTHPATGKGLLAPFRPQRGGRTGKNLAASLNDFFSVLHLQPLSRCGGSSPNGERGWRNRTLCAQAGNFAAMPKPPSMREVALPQAMTEGVHSPITPSAALRAPAPSKGERGWRGPHTLHASRKLCRHAKASPFGRGGSECNELTERASLLSAAPLPFAVQLLPVKSESRKIRRFSGFLSIKIIVPLKMPRAKRRAF